MYTNQSKSKVKNKQAAPMQITAEQIMREAAERQESVYEPPKQKIHDAEELEHFKVTKRKGFEDAIRRNQHHVGNWIKYAKFEEEHSEFKRARSVYERALQIDAQSILLWLKYADMEMRNKNVNRARNVWNRAVMLLPRVDQFWLKYILMEEFVGNFAGVRQVYERWMEWEPPERAWRTFINFEIKHGEYDRAREIFQRFVQVHPANESWIKYAKFEHKHGTPELARQVYQSALDFMGEDHIAECESLLVHFAEFETIVGEFDRARAIFQYALDHLPKGSAQQLYQKFIRFEKQFGEKRDIEDAIINRRRFHLEEEIQLNPKNFDLWFDYTRLEESALDGFFAGKKTLPDEKSLTRIRDVYERAISNVPPSDEKRFWRRYVYLWINYAVFEELHGSLERARSVYREFAKIVPHKKFSFSKLWILWAHFEVRAGDLAAARKVFGQAIGLAPKPKIFLAYIDLESQLGNLDRVRMLYQKWLETTPHDCSAWCKYAEMEDLLEEPERARAIFSAAISQASLDLPELVWKAFIDFEITEGEYGRVRELYEALLDRSQHVKVWISFAQFEFSIEEVANARAVYERAYSRLRSVENKEERLLLVQSWEEFEKLVLKEKAESDEQETPDQDFLAQVRKKFPQRVVKQRVVTNEDGSSGGMEEYYDYIFPDEVTSNPSKVLEIAKRWKRQKLQESDQPSSNPSESSNEDQSSEK